MKTLNIGYFCGEFGWHLMRWQGIARETSYRLKKKGVVQKTVVGCEEQYSYLYEDFADDFVFFNEEIKTRNMWMANNRIYPMIDASQSHGFHLVPTKKICLDPATPQRFKKFGTKHKPTGIILLHDRCTNNLGTGYRNWPSEKWGEIVSRLRGKGYGIFSIGSLSGANHINGTSDSRGKDLDALAFLMSCCRLLISPSSGPAHFASLCGCHHVVWGKRKNSGLIDNKERYETIWNPFGTKVEFIDSWNPEVKTVIEKVYKCLK